MFCVSSITGGNPVWQVLAARQHPALEPKPSGEVQAQAGATQTTKSVKNEVKVELSARQIMPRKSRVKDNYGVYHIKQRGSGMARLFEDEGDRAAFLDILKIAREKNNFRLLAYCISKEDEYHLILDSNGCDISQIMKEINIKYSIHKNCQGCLFKDRFQSELLSSNFAQKEEAEPTSANFREHTSFSSCQEFLKKLDEMNVLEEAEFESVPERETEMFQRGCRERISSVEEARSQLSEQAAAMGRPLEAIFKDKPLRNQLILRMKSCSTLSMKQIGEIFGGLSESSVSKLLNAGIR